MSLIQVNGEHEEGQTHSNVRMVYANKQTEPCKLPKDMKNFFPDLDGIKWVHGSLRTIDADDLDFPNLDLLDLLDNKLVSLPSDLFMNSPKLQWIQFDDNAIVHVGRKIFDALEEIETIRFRSNPCMNSMASTPEEIENLKSELLHSCPVGPAPLRCTINEEVNELTIKYDKHDDEISEIFDVIDDCKLKTDEMKAQMEIQFEEYAKKNERLEVDIDYLKMETLELNKTVDTSQKETERLNRQLISQNDLIFKLQTRLEKVENTMKLCQCMP